ncbi:MAG: hypothetical protein ABL865_02545, partial [Candidatus Nitrotoga sp.]
RHFAMPHLAANLLVCAGRAAAKQAGRRGLFKFLREVQNESAGNGDAKLKGVLLYSLARPSLRAEALRLSALSEQQLEVFAKRIRKLGVVVQVA